MGAQGAQSVEHIWEPKGPIRQKVQGAESGCSRQTPWVPSGPDHLLHRLVLFVFVVICVVVMVVLIVVTVEVVVVVIVVVVCGLCVVCGDCSCCGACGRKVSHLIYSSLRSPDHGINDSQIV